MEPTEVVLGAEGLREGMRVVQPLAERLFGPAVDEFGLTLREHARVFRLRQHVRLLGKVKKMLEDAGIEPERVPLRTLFPLMDGAALEEEESLVDMWAALLANAAGGKAGVAVPPSFITIMRQLAPLDARLLETVASASQKSLERGAWGIRPKSLRSLLKLDESSFEISLETVVRLGLVERQHVTFLSEEGYLSYEDPRPVRVSQLGKHFLRACTPPRPISQAPD